MSLKKSLPEIYKNILNPHILNINLPETKATCQNCLRSRDNRFPYLYQKDLKCCTFFPFLPNYAVGGILLKQTAPLGSQVVRQKISEQAFAVPLGLYPDLQYQFEFQNKKDEDFGNKESLLCPYYNKTDNQCNIWEFRGTVCTTFFCRSDYGKSGLQFWDIMSDYLSYVEMCLAEECLVLLDFSPRDISDQLVFLNKKEFTSVEKKKKYLDSKEMKQFWNGYKSPEDFYKICYSLVQNLTRKQMNEIMGAKGQHLESNVLEKYKSLV